MKRCWSTQTMDAAKQTAEDVRPARSTTTHTKHHSERLHTCTPAPPAPPSKPSVCCGSAPEHPSRAPPCRPCTHATSVPQLSLTHARAGKTLARVSAPPSQQVSHVDALLQFVAQALGAPACATAAACQVIVQSRELVLTCTRCISRNVCGVSHSLAALGM